MTEKIVVPVLGESITEATVAKWLKNAGDAVEADEPIVELETDKVNLEVPSPVKGVLTEINSKDGSVVEVGALLGSVLESQSVGSVKKEEIKKIKPTSTTDPSFEFISDNTPVIGEGTSKFTLSVSNSTIGSSASTASPVFLSHFATVASVILSPRTGTTIFSLIYNYSNTLSIISCC